MAVLSVVPCQCFSPAGTRPHHRAGSPRSVRFGAEPSRLCDDAHLNAGLAERGGGNVACLHFVSPRKCAGDGHAGKCAAYERSSFPGDPPFYKFLGLVVNTAALSNPLSDSSLAPDLLQTLPSRSTSG